MEDTDREEIRERKDMCGGCGAPIKKVGEIDDHRGDEYECTRDRCDYVEWRMYGDTYYELMDE